MARSTTAAREAPLLLNNRTLGARAPSVAVPTYNRAALTPGIVHIGVGGFHRAHQEVYLHELAELGDTEWGVIGVGLRSRAMKDALEPQDFLYTVVERDADRDAARVVGTLDAYLYAPEEPEAVLRALADERIALVTVTVTGAGYHVDPSTLIFDANAAEIQRDLQNPGRPATLLGYLVEGLDRRRRAGRAPFTVLSCDNVPRNGKVSRSAVVSFARLRDDALADWIDEHVSFPSSMVDRITPTTTRAVNEAVEREFGVGDRWPVVSETFRQWIIEDDFCNRRPPLERVGVQFVRDVEPYEIVKKRLLNGSHCALAYLGSLAGHRTTDAAMADPPLRTYVSRLMQDEVAPLLPDAPGIDIDDYQRMLLRRFANPKVKDELRRLARRGSTKVPAYLLPSIVAARAQQRRHPLLTLAAAAWIRYLSGIDLGGNEFTVEDPRQEELRCLARQGDGDPRPLLAQRSIFGALAHDADFADDVEAALRLLGREGVQAAIHTCLTMTTTRTTTP
jgi:mannitol 2-dehydrogenase